MVFLDHCGFVSGKPRKEIKKPEKSKTNKGRRLKNKFIFLHDIVPSPNKPSTRKLKVAQKWTTKRADQDSSPALFCQLVRRVLKFSLMTTSNPLMQGQRRSCAEEGREVSQVELFLERSTGVGLGLVGLLGYEDIGRSQVSPLASWVLSFFKVFFFSIFFKFSKRLIAGLLACCGCCLYVWFGLVGWVDWVGWFEDLGPLKQQQRGL